MLGDDVQFEEAEKCLERNSSHDVPGSSGGDLRRIEAQEISDGGLVGFGF